VVDLSRERLSNGFGSVGPRGDIGNDRHGRRAEFGRGRAEDPTELDLNVLHVSRMEWRADVEHDDAARAGRFDGGLYHHQVVFRACDHGLVVRVEVGDVEPAPCLAAVENLLDARRFEADDRCHPTTPDPTHELTTALDEPETRREIEDAGGVQGVVLTETVSGDERGRRTGAVLPRAIGHGVDDEERWLGELGETELVAWIVNAQPANRVPEDVVSRRRPIGESIEQVGAHSLRLRTLSWKNADDRHTGKIGPRETRHTIAMTPPSSWIAPGEVRVWHARTADVLADPQRVGLWLTWLQPAERVRYDRYRFEIDRLMFLLGRVMARAVVGRAAGVPPTVWRWREGPHGRPEIDEPGTSLRFNLAHSAGVVACALADGREIGIDVEDLDRRPTDRAIVRRYCSPDEVADIEAQPADGWHDRFLMYWTLKEAYLKARGLGVSVPLADVNFAVDGDDARIGFLGSLAGTDTRWLFHLAKPSNRFLMAVAASCADGRRPVISVEPLTAEGLDAWGLQTPTSGGVGGGLAQP
jgi:4'-phosphopantetheinyl transferase